MPKSDSEDADIVARVLSSLYGTYLNLRQITSR
jgi:hypothetical protein